jgi:hypothetical protein
MQIILDLPFSNLPHAIISKILLYYWSYGSPTAKIIQSEIINQNKGNSLWFANVDYIHNHRIYMLQKSIGCSFDAICDLRLAIIEHNIENGRTTDILMSMQKNVIKNLYVIKKNALLHLLKKEAENLIY